METPFPPFEPNGPDDSARGPRLREIPLRLVFPNLITILAICAGLTGIRLAFENRYELAVSMVLLAAFLDGIDGRVARLMKATSKFGAQMDSLADIVNFGVAPALVVYVFALDQARSLGWIAALIYAIAAGLRLARFNVMAERENKASWQSEYFVGVPAPAGAIVLLLPIYAQDLGLHLPTLTPLVLVYTLAIALLMVSRVPTFSGKLIGQKIAREHVLPVFVLVALFIACLLTYPSLTLAVGSIIYLALIPVSAYRYFQVERKMELIAKGQNGKGASEPTAAIEPPSFPR